MNWNPQLRVALCNSKVDIVAIRYIRLVQRRDFAPQSRYRTALSASDRNRAVRTAPLATACTASTATFRTTVTSPPPPSPQLPPPQPPLPPHPPLTRRPQGAGSASGNRLRGWRAGRVRSGARSDAFDAGPALWMQRRPAASAPGAAVAIGWVGGPADWDSWQWCCRGVVAVWTGLRGGGWRGSLKSVGETVAHYQRTH